MSNVFISHSSKDKPFVRRLALGLMAEGIPVWLDSWSMRAGNSLLDSVYDGIDRSSVVILVMSEHSINSGWVNKELNAALAKEDQVGRKFLIPIKIDGFSPPLKVADRIYADFSQDSFSQPLSDLADALTLRGTREMSVPADRELVGLSFNKEVDLDVVSLGRMWKFIRERHVDLSLSYTQVVVNDDLSYRFLKEKLHKNIDGIGARTNYSPELETGFVARLRS